jgi:hypothetical protein
MPLAMKQLANCERGVSGYFVSCHLTLYDQRGACETQIQADKGGLKLTQRRKQCLPAQEALVLLTDLAHNLLAWTVHWMALEPPLAAFGTTRLIEDY